MTPGRRLVDFALVWMIAAAVWMAAARWLSPYLELVAPVGALMALLLVVNVVDAIWFAVRHRSRFAGERTTSQPRQAENQRRQPPRTPAVGLGGTR